MISKYILQMKILYNTAYEKLKAAKYEDEAQRKFEMQESSAFL